MYGTSLKAVQDIRDTGRICILDVELLGVRNLRNKTDFDARFVLVKPPSLEVLEKRLRARDTETEQSIKKRLDRAKEDSQAAEREAGLFDHCLLNDDLDTACMDFKRIVHEDLAHFQ